LLLVVVAVVVALQFFVVKVLVVLKALEVEAVLVVV
jgi:hypothetical protein